MREYEVLITNDMLKTGLRPSYRNPRNLFRWVECQNVVCGVYGLATYNQIPFYISIDQLIGHGIDSLNWPNPQIFQGKITTIVTFGNRLFFVDYESGNLLEMSDIRSTENVNTELNPIVGGLWQFADMDDSWMMTNGRSVVMFYRKENIISGDDYVRCTNNVYIETMCQFMGRTVIGGMERYKFWHEDIISYMNSFGDNIYSDMNTDIQTVNDNYIMWSNVGIGLWWLFFPNLWKTGYVSAGYSEASRPYLFELINRGDLGWKHAGVGRVLQIKPLGELLVVYGTKGVSLFKHTIDPVPSMLSVGPSIRIAINNKGAVGGDDSGHVFLSQEGTLWSLDGSGKLERLNYQEYFVDDLDTDWVISFDSYENYYYICNGVTSYVLTKQGLSSTKQLVSSVIRSGDLYCTGSELLDQTMLLITDEFDNNRNEIDTLQWIKVRANETDLYTVAIDYKYKSNDTWSRSDFVSLNGEGAVFVGISGISFRIVLKVSESSMDDDSDFEPPDSVTYTFKQTDKRYTRGINVRNI